MSVHPRLVARRTTLGAAVVGLGIATGCDLDPTTDAPTGAAPSASADPDEALVADVVTALTRAAELVAATTARYPRWEARLGSLRTLHVAHGASLGAAIGPEFAHGGPLPGPVQAYAEVRRQERRLQGRLADGAVAARSGDLARVLASMSAGVAQALAALPAKATG